MVVIIKNNELVIKTEPKTFIFILPKDVDNNLKYKTDYIIKHNECLAEQTIKRDISLFLTFCRDLI